MCAFSSEINIKVAKRERESEILGQVWLKEREEKSKA